MTRSAIDNSNAEQTVTQIVGELLREGAPETIAPLTPDSENTVTEYACTHGLAGLIQHAITERGLKFTDANRQKLAESAAQIAARNLHLRHHLERVAQRLNNAGIDVMVLKGMALNHLIYDRLDLRPMTDVDLLFRADDIASACRTLKEAGCVDGETLLREDFFPRFYYEREFRPADAPNVKFDVHARLFRPWRYRSVPLESFWDGSTSIAIGGASVRVPGHEGMLIHLCVHAACHGASRLLWLLDIHRYARQFSDEIDWPAFADRVASMKLAWPTLVAIRAAANAFGATVPETVISTLESTPADWADRLALWQAPRDDRHPVARLCVDALVGGGAKDQLAYLGALLIPQRAHMADLYRIHHPGWLVCAHIWRVVRAGTRGITRCIPRTCIPFRHV
ncbi:MAG TPA: nucleotidyltransferase family protein [Phycisphaerae bacterium]|nr:nucleotidyltransferase family protein [Phycisphaerae bacterium]